MAMDMLSRGWSDFMGAIARTLGIPQTPAPWSALQR